MYFDSFAEFIAMGKHGLYVWLSYAIFLTVVLWNIWLVKSTRKQALRLLRLELKREDTRKREEVESKVGEQI